MKKYLLLLLVIIILASCGGGANKEAAPVADSVSSATTTSRAKDLSSNPDYSKGLALISQSNCLTCHKIAEDNIGPAYTKVAAKYAGNDTAVVYLAHKIIKGGKGVWGDAMMTPHPDVSEADAEQMVKYILLLKS